MIQRPMLAASIDDEQLENLDFPVLVSPKLDGIRCLVHPELGPVTRKFKHVPNAHIRRTLDTKECCGLDGELMLSRNSDFNSIQSAVMTRDGEPNFSFWVFDDFSVPEIPFYQRLESMAARVAKMGGRFVTVKHTECWTAEGVQACALRYVRAGFEGLMIRHPDGPYKEGRSTLKQGWLIKFKNFADAEGRIIGYEELMHNDNPQERDELGYAKRSSHKENQVPAGMLGALILETEWGELRVGSGFDHELRRRIWERREEFLGDTVTFKYQKHGMLEKPRFPIFLRFRDERA